MSCHTNTMQREINPSYNSYNSHGNCQNIHTLVGERVISQHKGRIGQGGVCLKIEIRVLDASFKFQSQWEYLSSAQDGTVGLVWVLQRAALRTVFWVDSSVAYSHSLILLTMQV